MAKLAAVTVLNIFALRRSGITQREIANLVGVAQSTISSICSRRLWKHLDAGQEVRS
jgi:transcriptional regulator